LRKRIARWCVLSHHGTGWRTTRGEGGRAPGTRPHSRGQDDSQRVLIKLGDGVLPFRVLSRDVIGRGVPRLPLPSCRALASRQPAHRVPLLPFIPNRLTWCGCVRFPCLLLFVAPRRSLYLHLPSIDVPRMLGAWRAASSYVLASCRATRCAGRQWPVPCCTAPSPNGRGALSADALVAARPVKIGMPQASERLWADRALTARGGERHARHRAHPLMPGWTLLHGSENETGE
jgi:hypothetical protein